MWTFTFDQTLLILMIVFIAAGTLEIRIFTTKLSRVNEKLTQNQMLLNRICRAFDNIESEALDEQLDLRRRMQKHAEVKPGEHDDSAP